MEEIFYQDMCRLGYHFFFLGALVDSEKAVNIHETGCPKQRWRPSKAFGFPRGLRHSSHSSSGTITGGLHSIRVYGPIADQPSQGEAKEQVSICLSLSSFGVRARTIFEQSTRKDQWPSKKPFCPRGWSCSELRGNHMCCGNCFQGRLDEAL
ncbi:hypothetical protein LMH87_005278 [Akanthomyces muscarius]|uniref:Uncharacterized protein n=1 Tax=Akanthomyces muscarius TaxID=2231603 RepID=A0A9W8QNI2_AKAMU|nr:hypothetical protein LMH87_005278 [Akanthomyces muscarius]KAJ4163557.1 hypothetical protein LMH87_005278 [Akanthomyces muscarius]